VNKSFYQERFICDFLAGRGEVIESFTEIESGRKNDRPKLAAATRQYVRSKTLSAWAMQRRHQE
jgi:hypothetical protein